MAEVFRELAEGNNQIVVTTHSPLFVSGQGFEDTRLVRRSDTASGTSICSLTFDDLCQRIRTALRDNQERKIDGLVAKIHQALQPGIAEMFFARVPILVEGLEDVSYITTELHLSNQWTDFRRLGCHLIPVNGKSRLIQPLAIAVELRMPVFVVFDADGDAVKPEHRKQHERDNLALIDLLGESYNAFPAVNECRSNHAIWRTNLTDVVKVDFGAEYELYVNAVRVSYAQEGGLEKHDLFIADWLSAARSDGYSSQTLAHLCQTILTFAQSV